MIHLDQTADTFTDLLGVFHFRPPRFHEFSVPRQHFKGAFRVDGGFLAHVFHLPRSWPRVLVRGALSATAAAGTATTAASSTATDAAVAPLEILLPLVVVQLVPLFHEPLPNLASVERSAATVVSVVVPGATSGIGEVVVSALLLLAAATTVDVSSRRVIGGIGVTASSSVSPVFQRSSTTTTTSSSSSRRWSTFFVFAIPIAIRVVSSLFLPFPMMLFLSAFLILFPAIFLSFSILFFPSFLIPSVSSSKVFSPIPLSAILSRRRGLIRGGRWWRVVMVAFPFRGNARSSVVGVSFPTASTTTAATSLLPRHVAAGTVGAMALIVMRVWLSTSAALMSVLLLLLLIQRLAGDGALNGCVIL